MSKEQELRELLVAAGNRLVEENLVQGTWGNISVRLDESKMLVSPSGLDYGRLTPSDMVVVDINTLEYDPNGRKPTSEKKIHAAIYRDRPEIGAAIHSHPMTCSVIASTNLELPVMSEKMKKLVGGSAKVGKYGLPSTKKLTNGTIEALKGRNACFMANHGIMACGKDLDEAFDTCAIMEESSKLFIQKKAEEMSGKPFNENTIEELFLSKYSK